MSPTATIGPSLFRANEVDDIGSGFHHPPGVVVEIHAHEHIAGENLFLLLLALAGSIQLEAHPLWDHHFDDLIGHIQGCCPLQESAFNLVFAASSYLNGVPAQVALALTFPFFRSRFCFRSF